VEGVELLENGDQWEAVAAAVRSMIAKWQPALEQARADGKTPADLWADLAELSAGLDAGRFATPGALYWRLTTGQWPPDSETYARRKIQLEKAQEHAKQRQRTKRHNHQAEQSDAELARLEADFGHILDGMTPNDLENLRQQLPEFYRRKQLAPGGMARYLALLEIEQGVTA
jgi:hypothetical protein